jgi:uncharacterized protein (DUF1015 family)
MTKIRPFRAITYNQEKIKDYSCVVCPPYDIISPEKQAYYYELSNYNLIHILLGKDVAGEDKYQRAASYFRDWLKNRIFIQDEGPAIYFYSQEYKIRGEKRLRLGFISLLHLEDKNSSIFGHEHTCLEPKEDRFRLLKQVKANLSPIFVIFLDKKRIIQRTYQYHIQDKRPFIDMVDDEKIIHKLWRLDSPDILNNIQSSMSGENIFIADGHHRYEVACAYRELMKKKLDAITGEEGFDYILTYFTNTDSRGLSILPVHRLLKFDSEMNFDTFKLKLKDYFDIEEIKEKNRLFFLMEKGGCTEHVLGMYKDKKFYLLRLKNIKILDKVITDKPKEYRLLDVVIFNYLILKKILGIDPEDKQSIAFGPSKEEFVERVDNEPLYIAFFLNPVRVEQIISVALKGERMPAKSTYFYPKVLAGLVINKFDVTN